MITPLGSRGGELQQLHPALVVQSSPHHGIFGIFGICIHASTDLNLPNIDAPVCISIADRAQAEPQGSTRFG